MAIPPSMSGSNGSVRCPKLPHAFVATVQARGARLSAGNPSVLIDAPHRAPVRRAPCRPATARCRAGRPAAARRPQDCRCRSCPAAWGGARPRRSRAAAAASGRGFAGAASDELGKSTWRAASLSRPRPKVVADDGSVYSARAGHLLCWELYNNVANPAGPAACAILPQWPIEIRWYRAWDERLRWIGIGHDLPREEAVNPL